MTKHEEFLSMIDFIKGYLFVIIISLLIGKAIVLITAPEPDIPNSVPAQQTFIKSDT